MKYIEVCRIIKQAADESNKASGSLGRLQPDYELALLLAAMKHPANWKRLNLKDTRYPEGDYALDAWYDTNKGKVPRDFTEEQLDEYERLTALMRAARGSAPNYSQMQIALNNTPTDQFKMQFKYPKK